MANITYKNITITTDKDAEAAFAQLSYDMNVMHPVRHIKMRFAYGLTSDEDTTLIFKSFNMFRDSSPVISTGAFVANGLDFIYNSDLSSCEYTFNFNAVQRIQGTYNIDWDNLDGTITGSVLGYIHMTLAFYEHAP